MLYQPQPTSQLITAVLSNVVIDHYQPYLIYITGGNKGNFFHWPVETVIELNPGWRYTDDQGFVIDHQTAPYHTTFQFAGRYRSPLYGYTVGEYV